MQIECVMLEVGKLLEKTNCEYECYSKVFDQGNGYYNENNILYPSVDCDTALEYAKEYVAKGNDATYAIISKAGNVYFDDEEGFDDGNIGGIDKDAYSSESVLYSLCKINEEYKENFVKTIGETE